MSIAEVLSNARQWHVEQGDVVPWLRSLPEASVDLVLCSPPYEQARLYLESGEDMGIARDTEEWVAWLVEVCEAMRHACKGLCVLVIEGQTRSYRYSAGPLLLAADLHRRGFHLRKPPIYRRVGIPGSGGPDWWRNDYEFCVCFTRGGRLPWSDNTATGHPPKWAPGGAMSSRLADGARVNQWGMRVRSDGSLTATEPSATHDSERKRKPSHVTLIKGRATGGTSNGDTQNGEYTPPALANPGNVIDCKAGGGNMGSELCHDNEAPYPEQLVEPFIRCFCPEGGIVCDPFSGSGTTGAVAARWGRRFLGCDLRRSQVDLSVRRLKGEATLFDGARTEKEE